MIQKIRDIRERLLLHGPSESEYVAALSIFWGSIFLVGGFLAYIVRPHIISETPTGPIRKEKVECVKTLELLSCSQYKYHKHPCVVESFYVKGTSNYLGYFILESGLTEEVSSFESSAAKKYPEIGVVKELKEPLEFQPVEAEFKQAFEKFSRPGLRILSIPPEYKSAKSLETALFSPKYKKGELHFPKIEEAKSVKELVVKAIYSECRMPPDYCPRPYGVGDYPQF